MAESFKKLPLKRYPAVQQRESAEGRFWRRFQKTAEQKLTAPATSIQYSPIAPFDVAVSSSLSILIYDAKSGKQKKALSRFNDVAYSAQYRHDGRLIAAGGEEGVVRTFEASSGSTLRHLKGHSAAVHSVSWSMDGLQLISGSDDKLVKLWDVPTQDNVWKSKYHGDSVRKVASSPISPYFVASGGYDHMVCLWDTRSHDTSRPVFSVNHEHPVEDLQFHGGSLLISAGGNEIKVWDIFSGGKMIHKMNNHQKTITSICMDSTKTRLLSGGMDGHLKVYNVSNFAVTHGFKYNAPILSVAVSPDNMNIMVGTTDGMLTTRHRDVKLLLQSKVKAVQPEYVPGGTKRHFERGQNLKHGGTNANAVTISDMQALVQRKQRLRPYDIALKKFRYHDALDAALASRNPNVVVTVLEELVNRQGLERALSNRDEVTLEPILSFLARYTTNPRYASLLTDVCSIVFEMYKSVLGQSEAIDELFTRLGRQVKLEIGFQKQLLHLLGSLDTIMNSSTSSFSSSV